MKAQKNLLYIPMFFAFVWGIFGLVAPGVVFKMLKTPVEMVNSALVTTQTVLAVSQISLGIIVLWMRSIEDKKLMSGAMTVVSLVLLLFGLHGVLHDLFIAGAIRNMIVFIQGIVFLLLAVLFFLKRKAA